MPTDPGAGHEPGCSGNDACQCATLVLCPVRLESGRVLYLARPAAPAGWLAPPLWDRASAPPAPLAGAVERRRGGHHQKVTHGNTLTTQRGDVVKTKPVAVLTTVYTILIIALGTTAITGALPPLVVTIATAVAAVLGVILGVRTYNSVTPLADPRDAAGRPAQLVARVRGSEFRGNA